MAVSTVAHHLIRPKQHMGSTGVSTNGAVMGSQPPPSILYGTGTPAGTLSPWKDGAKGSLYIQTDATADDMAVWVKMASNNAVADWRLMRGYNNPIVNATAATLTVTALAHAGRIVTLNRAAGIAVTLPAAIGSGDVYKFVVGTTFTGAASIAVASGTDYFIGHALNGIDGGTAVPHLYPTANTGTVATESDTISLFGTANAQGGIKGQIVTITDIASAVFQIESISDAGGTEATPFSAAV